MDDTDHADVQDSTPGSAGPHRAAGSMGVSSERTGPTGPDQDTTDGVRDTSTIDDQSPEDPPEQRPGGLEENPDGLEPKAGYPSLDPRDNPE
jgi:hypothetical protein